MFFRKHDGLFESLVNYALPVAWANLIWNLVRLWAFYTCYEDQLACDVIFRPYELLVGDTLVASIFCGFLFRGIGYRDLNLIIIWVSYTTTSVFVNLMVNQAYGGGGSVVYLAVGYLSSIGIVIGGLGREIFFEQGEGFASRSTRLNEGTGRSGKNRKDKGKKKNINA